MTSNFRVFEKVADIPIGAVVMNTRGDVATIQHTPDGTRNIRGTGNTAQWQPPFIELLDPREAGHTLGILHAFTQRTEGDTK